MLLGNVTSWEAAIVFSIDYTQLKGSRHNNCFLIQKVQKSENSRTSSVFFYAISWVYSIAYTSKRKKFFLLLRTLEEES